ncbi:cation:proton antiporter [Planktothrix mougeotii]|uniref:Cation:proton antiporter n=1 Tax=Planktothrix mougeotii LEGE 06226 TaxID=1828728 RepID=A0ABR9U8Q6_9CYAN|nr:cation:proton antiporter [Planktothrix mougeotii]MBE9142812.1 cation:proton antiporter [Planktothrix mougeotii LEGE 06226]
MHPAILVLLQVLIVIGLSRLMGLVCRGIKQPLVIGEIIAGIMLGPSLLGLIAPNVMTALFPPETLSYLNVLSEIGLIFFMFLIGLELNPKYLSGQLEKAILISHVSIVVPFALGISSALILYPIVSNDSVSFTAFALFLGSALSITAFPVLARIITENNLQGTRLGTLALTCAAVDDVTAWCLLALAIAVTRTNSISGAFPTIIESILYIILMVTAGRWLLQKLSVHYQRTGRLTQWVLAWIYMGVVASALITELIGIHLIFGAFLVGAVMPKNPGLVREIAEKTEDFVLIFLLPIFFAYSGLRTEIGLLNRPELWLLCGLVIAVAIIGKYVGTYVAARVSGIEKREASALGWLMNTRGLTELIVLNIGLSLGVISPLLFTLLVIMALVTTFMTSPLLEMTYPKELIKLDVIEPELQPISPQPINPSYRVLVPVANPNTQKGLLKLALAIAGKPPAVVHPLSLVELEEDYLFQSTPDEANRLISEQQKRLEELIESLDPPELRQGVYPIIRIAHDVAKETGEIALADQANLILVGWHRPAFSDNRLGGRVGKILNNSPTDVAVFVNKEQQQIQSLLVAYASNIHDDLGLTLALRMMFNDPNCRLKILVTPNEPEEELSYELRNMIDVLPPWIQSRLQLIRLQETNPIQAVIEASKTVDLTIAGTSRTWGIERQTLGRYTDQLAQDCYSSLLITRSYSQVTSHIESLLQQPINT